MAPLMPHIRWIVVFATIVCQTGLGDEFDSVRDLIRARMTDEHIPSVVVGVAHGEHVLWKEAFGWADRENRTPATTDTAYRIGSATKPMTATAVMTLIQRGNLQLDQPVNELLGDVKIEARLGDVDEATLLRVLQHTSGLPGHWETYFPDEREPPSAVDTLIARYGKLLIPPGEQFHYSNLGYTILGDIVERHSDKSFGDFLRDEVFAPLGMSNSFLAVGDFSTRRRAVGYRANGERVPDIKTSVPGAGDVYSTVDDLLRFGMFHNKLHLPGQTLELQDELIEKMQQTTVPMGNEEYGLGWHVRTDAAGRRHILHGGAHVGWECHFDMIPTEKLCVAVLANKDVKWPGYRVALAVTDAIFAVVLDCPLDQVQPKDGHELGHPSDEPSGLPGKLTGQWEGKVHTYQGQMSLSILFQEDGDVHAKLGNQLIALVNDARLHDTGSFTGRMVGDVGTNDARRRTYYLDWDLKLRNGDLVGILYAVGRDPFGPNSGRGLHLSHWVRIQRQQATE